MVLTILSSLILTYSAPDIHSIYLEIYLCGEKTPEESSEGKRYTLHCPQHSEKQRPFLGLGQSVLNS